MLLNPLPLQEAGTEASFGFAEAVTSKSTGPPFREILFNVQQHLNGPPNRSGPGPVPAEPETEPTYPSLAALIAEILAEKAPRPSPEKMTGGTEVSVAQLQNEESENSALTVPSELPSTDEPATTDQTFLSGKPMASGPHKTDTAESFPEGKIQPESDIALSTGNAKTLPVQENELPANTATAEESQNNPEGETSVPLVETERQLPGPQAQPRENGQPQPAQNNQQVTFAGTSGVAPAPPQNSTADENESQNAETELPTRENAQPQPAQNNQQVTFAGTSGVTPAPPQNSTAAENESQNTETELPTRENAQPQPAQNNQQVTFTGPSGVAPAPPQNSTADENEPQIAETELPTRENAQPQPTQNNQQVTFAGTSGVTPAPPQNSTADENESQNVETDLQTRERVQPQPAQNNQQVTFTGPSGVAPALPQNSTANENESQNTETELLTRENVQPKPVQNNQQVTSAGSSGVTSPQNSTANENESQNTETELLTRENVQPKPVQNNQQVTSAGPSGVAPAPQQNSTANENESQIAETDLQTRENVQPQHAQNNQQVTSTGPSGVAPAPPQNSTADENESQIAETDLQTRENVQPQPTQSNQQVTSAGLSGVASAPPQNPASEENQPQNTENQRPENLQPQPAQNNQQVASTGMSGVETPLRNATTTDVKPASKQDVSDAKNQPPISAASTETVSATAAKQQPIIAPTPGETQPSNLGTQQEPVRQANSLAAGGNIPSTSTTTSASPRETIPVNTAPASQTPKPSDPVLGTIRQSAGANIPQPTAPRRNSPTQELPEDVELQVRETQTGQEPVRRASLSREQAETQPDPEHQETPVAFRAEPIPHRSESSQVQTAQPDMSASVRPAQGSTTINANAAPRAGVADQPQDPHQVTDQIVRGARMLSRDGTTEVTVRLDPPELGSVTIRLQTQNNSLSGEITVENRQVHDVVHGRLADLREALSNQGIQVDRIEVAVDGRGASGPDRDASNSFFRENSQRSTPQDNPERQRRSPQWDNRREQRPAPQEGHVDFTA